MNLLVDTNRYRDYCDGVIETLEVFRSAASISFPFIVLGELRAGFVWGQKAEENEARLMGLLHSERVRTLYPDDQTTHHYARLYNQLRTQGTPIPSNDLWIAALSAQHNLLLYSRDEHFDKLPQLARV